MAFGPADIGLQPHLNDKLLHATGFFGAAILAHFAHPRAPHYRHIIGLACFGLLIELVQAYLPHRSFSLLDWGADILGVLIYFIFFSTFMSRFVPKGKALPD